MSPGPGVVVGHVDIKLLGGIGGTNDLPDSGILSKTEGTRGSSASVVPVVLVNRVGRVDQTWANSAEVLSANSLGANVDLVSVSRSVITTVGTNVSWRVVLTVVDGLVEVVLSIDWLVLTGGELSTASLPQAILLEGLNVLTQKGDLELHITLEAKLSSNGRLVLVQISVDVDLFRSTPEESEWVLILSHGSLTDVGISQSAGSRFLELVGGSEGSQIVGDVVLEHLQEHASEDNLARLRVVIIIEELDVDVAHVVSRVLLSQSTKWHVNVASGSLEHDVESPAIVPQVSVGRAWIGQLADTAISVLTGQVTVERCVDLVQKVGKLVPQVVWKTQANEVSGNDGVLSLVWITEWLEVGALWILGGGIWGNLTEAH